MTEPQEEGMPPAYGLTRVTDEWAREIATADAEQRKAERDAFITGND
ncbi:hypothetical protein ACWC0A_34585 [Streptomyces scopuliridis]